MIPFTVYYIILSGLLLLSSSQNIFLPNLPMGEYRLVFETLSSCESTKNHSIQYNLYFSKISSILIEVKGNITMMTPFNDDNFIDLNLASWSSLGGWKENAMVYKSNKACSNIKNLLGYYGWSSIVKAFNFPSENCPIPPGTYISSGLDPNNLQNNNFPKVFFYGKYKCVIKLLNKNGKLRGCIETQLKIVRPWEVPKNEN